MADTSILKSDDILEALKDVYDPEIPINVVDLGLIYDTDVTADGDVSVKMTLTFAGCGMGPQIAQMAEDKISEIEGVGEVDVEMVFDHPWNPEMISEAGKLQLGMED